MSARVSLFLAAGLLSQSISEPTEQYLRENYVRDDGPRYETGYPRVATHRFQQARLVAKEELSPFRPFYYRSVAGRRVNILDDGETPYVPSEAFAEAVEQVLRCLPQLSQYRHELFAPERVRLENGEEIVTYYLYSLRSASDSPLWLSGFVVMADGVCASLPETPATIDVDRGGTTREVWDAFDFAGTRFILAHTYGYEERGFELFRVEQSRLTLVLDFWFACVGCE